MKEFKKELRELINKHSLENGSNTPDFLLAEYLVAALKNFNKTISIRDKKFRSKLSVLGH